MTIYLTSFYLPTYSFSISYSTNVSGYAAENMIYYILVRADKHYRKYEGTLGDFAIMSSKC